MKQFFISLAATVTGIFVSFFLLFIILVGIGMAMVSSATSDKVTYVKENSVLQIKFDAPVTERTSKNPFENLSVLNKGAKHAIGLDDILADIKKAKDDDHIKGIFIALNDMPAGIATVEEIRNALIDFKTGGKFIYAYSEVFSQKAYYLSSVADKIYLHPEGGLDFKGIAAQVMFFKGALEKLEIEPQIFRHGKFKSAIEPFFLDKMSDANRHQTLSYINSIWDHLLEGIAKERKLTVADLNHMADSLLVRNPAEAVRLKLVDEVKYYDEVQTALKEKLSIAAKDEISFVSLKSYANAAVSKKEKYEKSKIALIYAVGQIESGEGDDETIGSERIAKAVAQAKADSAVKAIVLRVNSPGGSALASDVIWREVMLAQKVKPVVVSMGDVAASGGYYISCAADAIIAEPNTITGSIGVFGLLPNAQKFFNNKLGITVDTVKTNKHSDFGSLLRPVSDGEKKVIQQGVEDIYQSFISKVAEGRHMTKNQVDSIGQGRVWSGVDAKKIGLVDELGNLKDAIALAAKKAHLENYRISELPKLKDPFEELVKGLTGDAETSLVKKELGDQYIYYKHLQQLLRMKGVQARMPYDVVID